MTRELDSSVDKEPALQTLGPQFSVRTHIFKEGWWHVFAILVLEDYWGSLGIQPNLLAEF